MLCELLTLETTALEFEGILVLDLIYICVLPIPPPFSGGSEWASISSNQKVRLKQKVFVNMTLKAESKE